MPFFVPSSKLSSISFLESQNQDLEKENANLKFSITQLNSELNSLRDTIAQQEKILKSIQPFLDFEKFKIDGSFASLQELWMSWGTEIHIHPSQKMRQERATSNALTPLNLDVRHATGHFRGKEQDYTTTLISCECTDFKRRLLPCKHMYRLAYELDVYMLDEVQINPNIHNVLRVDQLKHRLKLLSRPQIDLLSEIACSESLVVENLSTCRSLLDHNFIQISSNKELLLNSYTKDDLFTFIENSYGIKIPKKIAKAGLVDLIISDYPDVITDLEKHFVNVEIHQNIQPLLSYLKKELGC